MSTYHSALAFASNAPTSVYFEQGVFDMGFVYVNSLVQETLKSLSSQDPGRLVYTPPNVTAELFYKSAPGNASIGAMSQGLPAYAQTRRLVTAAIDHIYPLGSIVSIAQLMNTFNNMHDSGGPSSVKQTSDDVMLLRMVVGLGYLCSAAVHLEAGCHHARTERYVHLCIPTLEAENFQYQALPSCQVGHRWSDR